MHNRINIPFQIKFPIVGDNTNNGEMAKEEDMPMQEVGLFQNEIFF